MCGAVMKCKFLKITALSMLIAGCAQERSPSAQQATAANAGLAQVFAQIQAPAVAAQPAATPAVARDPFAAPAHPEVRAGRARKES